MCKLGDIFEFIEEQEVKDKLELIVTSAIMSGFKVIIDDILSEYRIFIVTNDKKNELCFSIEVNFSKKYLKKITFNHQYQVGVHEYGYPYYHTKPAISSGLDHNFSLPLDTAYETLVNL